MQQPEPESLANRQRQHLTPVDDDDPVALIPRTALDVPEAAVRREMPRIKAQSAVIAFGKEITDAQAALVARLAIAYGLDPLAGEIMLLGGKPYVGLDGRLRKASEHPAFDGIECVPATSAEREAFRCREDEDLWKATVYRRDRRVPTVGWGRCSATQETVIGSGGQLVPNTIARRWSSEMAQKRAKHRALRDAFSMPLPGVEERAEPRGAFEAYPGGYVADAPVIEAEFASGIERGDSPGGVTPAVMDTAAPQGVGEPGARPTEPPAETVTRGQLANIHILLKGAGLDEATYRGLLERLFGVTSSRDLLAGQAAAFAEALAAEVLTKTRAGRQSERLTAEQVERIEARLRSFAEDPDGERQRAKRQADAANARAEEQGATAEPEEKPTAEELAEYGRAMWLAQDLGIDLAFAETDATTSRAHLVTILTQLRARITDRAASLGLKPHRTGQLIHPGSGQVYGVAAGEEVPQMSG